jgi:hypothetical protein
VARYFLVFSLLVLAACSKTPEVGDCVAVKGAAAVVEYQDGSWYALRSKTQLMFLSDRDYDFVVVPSLYCEEFKND